MDEGLNELNRFLKPTAAEPQPAGEPHPEVDQLVALHHQQLPQPEQQQLEAHVIGCHQCAEILKGIARFFDHLPPQGSAAEIIRTWEGFRQSVEVSEPQGYATTSARPVEEEVEPRWRRPPKGFVARQTVARMAASFTLIVLALGGLSFYEWWKARKAGQAQSAAEQRVSRLWDQLQALEQQNQGLKEATQGEMAALNEKIKELSGPRLNWPVYDVFSLAFLRRAGGQKKANEIELPPAVSGFSLILNPDSQARYPGYRVEIVDGNSQIVWQGDGLQRNRLDAFNIALTRELLLKDRYTIKVYGKSGTRLTLLGEFPIVIKQLTATTSPPSAHN